MQIDQLILQGGDAITTIFIRDKGKIFFRHRKGDPPRIDFITLTSGVSYDTSFQCEYQENGKRSYAYDVLLDVTKDAYLGDFFDFEIKTIDDLFTRFDDLVNTLKSFPVLEEAVFLTDNYGTKDFVKDPDPRYAFKIDPKEKAICYRYVRVTQADQFYD